MSTASLTFYIHYNTVYGQQIVISMTGASPIVREGVVSPFKPTTKPSAAISQQTHHIIMKYIENGLWKATVTLPLGSKLLYTYYFVSDEGAEFTEVGPARPLSVDANQYVIEDKWLSGGTEAFFFCDAITQLVYNRTIAPRLHLAEPVSATDNSTSDPANVIIRVWEPRVFAHEDLYIVGSSSHIGKWDVKHAVKMDGADYPLWSVKLSLSESDLPLNYKFFVKDGRNEGAEILWETDENRVIKPLSEDKPAAARVSISQQMEQLANSEDETATIAVSSAVFVAPAPITCVITHNNITVARPLPIMAGTSTPVFSLRSHNDTGVGDFEDLKRFVGFCAASGLTILHVAPVFDTSFTLQAADSDPYLQISSFALHPMYMNLQACLNYCSSVCDSDTPTHAEESAFTGTIASFQSRIDILNIQFADLRDSGATWGGVGKLSSPRAGVDYEHSLRIKLGMLRDLFRAFGKLILRSTRFAEFFRESRHWLQPYALYCLFRDLHGVADFQSWGKRAQMTPSHVHSLTDPSQFHYKAVSFWYFVQFMLHEQLLEVTSAAKAARVMLVVDLNITVHQQSVDAWMNPSVFMKDYRIATAKNETFSSGFVHPTLPVDWTALKEDCSWLRSRLSHIAQYFDGIRLVHLRDFLSPFIVEKSSVTSLTGHYHPTKGYTAAELGAFGLTPADISRLTTPYIKEWTLRSALGPSFAEVALRYFDMCSDGSYVWKSTLNTEAAIVEASQRFNNSSSSTTASSSDAVVGALLKLQSNVSLIKVGDEYHVRNGMLEATSYLELDQTTRLAMKKVYDDYFSKRQQGVWRDSWKTVLSLIRKCAPQQMLLLADDVAELDELSAVLNEYAVVGTRNPRVPQGTGSDACFSQPQQYPYLCSAVFSDFCTSSLRGWWEHDHEMAMKYVYSRIGAVAVRDLPADCSPRVVNMLLAHLSASSAAVLLPTLQDWIALDADLRSPSSDERVNVPSILHSVWKFRFHAYVEDLVGDAGSVLRATIAQLLSHSGRLLTSKS